MRAYGEACAAAERERCTNSELAEQCAVYARRIMELEKALGECSGALEHAGHPIEWQAKIDAAVAAERERIIRALGSLLQCPCCGETMDCSDDCTFAVDCPAEAANLDVLRDAVRA